MIIGFQLTVIYSEERPLGQNLVPSEILYCRGAMDTTTEAVTTIAEETTADATTAASLGSFI